MTIHQDLKEETWKNLKVSNIEMNNLINTYAYSKTYINCDVRYLNFDFLT